METFKILKKADLESEDYAKRLLTLKETNPNMHQYLTVNMQESTFPGIRSDVFSFICDNAEKFSDAHEFAYNIVQLTGNSKVDITWFEWFCNNYERFAKTISDSEWMDLFLIVVEAIEKNVPVSVFEGMYEKHRDDLLFIFEDIDDYDGSKNTASFGDTDKEETQQAVNPGDAAYDDGISDSDTNDVPDSIDQKGNLAENPHVETTQYNRDPEYADMFDSLLSIMKDDKHSGERFAMQDKIQANLTEISSSFSSIFRLWDNDRDEIERLRALYKLQQKVLYSQQKKMNEMRSRIVDLQSQLAEAGKQDIKQQELRKKISEIQSLMFPDVDLIGVDE